MSACDEPWCISFLAPLTLVDPAFWEELYERKLKIYKLDSDVEPISVYYSCSDGKNAESFILDGSSFRCIDKNKVQTVERLSVEGILVNVNTIEVSQHYGSNEASRITSCHHNAFIKEFDEGKSRKWIFLFTQFDSRNSTNFVITS